MTIGNKELMIVAGVGTFMVLAWALLGARPVAPSIIGAQPLAAWNPWSWTIPGFPDGMSGSNGNTTPATVSISPAASGWGSAPTYNIYPPLGATALSGTYVPLFGFVGVNTTQQFQ